MNRTTTYATRASLIALGALFLLAPVASASGCGPTTTAGTCTFGICQGLNTNLPRFLGFEFNSGETLNHFANDAVLAIICL